VIGDRRLIMTRIRSALAPLAHRTPAPDYADDIATARPARGGKTSMEAFAEQLALARGRLFTDARALAVWLRDQGATRGYCDPALLDDLGPRISPPLALEVTLDRTRIDDYAFGITRAVGAIAETGTVILNDATTSRRLGALAPWIHVAVVEAADIQRTVADAIRSLGADPYVVWCTGPSKTADVEGILIEGVHGPGEQVVLVR
jgi:L-lactate dehydrogenase complex protein LldG